MEDNKENGWTEYRRLVMSELEQLKVMCTNLSTQLNLVDKRITIIETKAGVIGAICGAVCGLIPTFYEILKSFTK